LLGHLIGYSTIVGTYGTLPIDDKGAIAETNFPLPFGILTSPLLFKLTTDTAATGWVIILTVERINNFFYLEG
jgi:hypothetical protein